MLLSNLFTAFAASKSVTPRYFLPLISMTFLAISSDVAFLVIFVVTGVSSVLASVPLLAVALAATEELITDRSEERRVGKEC